MGYFENRYKGLCPDFTSTVEVRPALRVNTLKTTDKVLVKRLRSKKVTLEKIPWLKHGYWYKADFSLGAMPEYLFGQYYLQGGASQLVSEVLDPKPRELILDATAAPGSKTTHIAMLMENSGTIVCLDMDTRRLTALQNNCERLMVKNTLLFKKNAEFVNDLAMHFDRVLIDAPCSGNFCSEEGWFKKWRIDEIEQNSRVQKKLFRGVYGVLKEGGTLVYSTCSLEPEEDELIIDWALREFPDLEVGELKIELGDEGITEWKGSKLDRSLSKTRRFWPHKTGTEGFFVAKLIKKPRNR